LGIPGVQDYFMKVIAMEGRSAPTMNIMFHLVHFLHWICHYRATRRTETAVMALFSRWGKVEWGNICVFLVNCERTNNVPEHRMGLALELIRASAMTKEHDSIPILFDLGIMKIIMKLMAPPSSDIS
jgi:hypothetical protein